MKKKELKNLAKRIAELEGRLHEEGLAQQEKQDIEREIFSLCSKVGSLEDIDILDELIQKSL